MITHEHDEHDNSSGVNVTDETDEGLELMVNPSDDDLDLDNNARKAGMRGRPSAKNSPVMG